MLAVLASCDQLGRVRTAFVPRPGAACSGPRGAPSCGRRERKAATIFLLQRTLTETFYSASDPCFGCSHTTRFPLDIYRTDVPYRTIPRLEASSTASGTRPLTFVFFTRHRLHACFTRCLVFCVATGVVDRCIASDLQDIPQDAADAH